MSLLNWRDFSRRPDIQHLPLQEQLYLFEQENKRKTEQNWFLEAQLMNGGGGGGGFAGNASDGPLSGATVTSDVGTTTTDTLGNFTFAQTPSTEITVTGGTDAVTGVAFTGELKGFPQYKTVSPLTTLAFHLKEEDTTLTADRAVNLLFASSSTLFGIELDVTNKDVMLNKDYVAESILADNQAAIAAQSIATYLESVTEIVGSAVKGADNVNFTNNSAKVEGYRSIARQIRDTSGAKTEINAQTLFDKVKLPNGSDWTGALTGSLDRTNRETIKTQLDNVRNQLGTLSRSEAYSANYLTTQIQAINRGVKEDYAVEADKLAKGQDVTFDTIDTMIGKSTGSLAQIESGKTNETTRSEGAKPETFYTFGAMTFTQTSFLKTKTLSGTVVEGNIKAISRSSTLFTLSDGLNKYLLDPVRSEAISFQEATNYSSRAETIVAKQNTPSDENLAANKVWQLTLNTRNFQIKDAVLVDAPASGGHLFSTGTYTLSMSGTRVTQVLTKATRDGVTTLSFGAVLGLRMDSINVAAGRSGATEFAVTFGRSIVTPPAGTAFSGNGDRSTLNFEANNNNYTITYTTG